MSVVHGTAVLAADRRTRVSALLGAAAVPVGLFLLAALVRAAVAGLAHFPITEDGAYYVSAARQLVEGHGLTTLQLWSYSTPPLVLPRPAFELWLPMASFIAAIPMSLLGTSFAAAQTGMVLLGAVVAPLAWWVARDTCRALDVPPERTNAVAIGSGLLAATLGAFVLPAADPDSTTPFLVFGVSSAVLLSGALRSGSRGRGLCLGICLGLTYLSRQETVWMGVATLALLWTTVRDGRATWLTGSRARDAARWLAPVIVGGLIVVVPWLIRQWWSFGSPLPGQALENALHIKGEDIYAWLDRPSIERFLAQGPATIARVRADALLDQAWSVLLAPAFPVGILGIAGLVALRRRLLERRSVAVLALVISGVLVFLLTALLFPVATLWGTYRHAAGPALVALVVGTAIWADDVVARYARWRGWSGSHRWLAPAVLVACTTAVCVAQAVGWQQGADSIQRRVAVVAAELRPVISGAPATTADDTPAPRAVLMTDRPMWLGQVLEVPMIALPDEPLWAVADLARHFGVDTLVVLERRGRYPDALFASPRDPCLADDPRPIGPVDQPAWLVRLDTSCVQP